MSGMRWRRGFGWALVAGFAVLVVAWALHRPVLAQVGWLLVFESAGVDSVDAVVVLPGSVPDRALGAADLLHERRAAHALLVQDRGGTDLAYLEGLGIHRMRDFEVNREILIRLGIAPEKIHVLPAGSGSTREDALALSSYLKNSDINSVAIITCKYHSYRAYLNFRSHFQGTGVTVYSLPSSHCRFDPERWWTRRDQIKTVYIELGKLVAYGLGVF